MKKIDSQTFLKKMGKKMIKKWGIKKWGR